MVGVTIGGKPLAGFDRPLELLKDCHRRIEHFLGVLQTAVELFGEGDLPYEGRRALETSLEYFTRAAPRHTADEEESLFPRMRRSADAETLAVMAEIDRLESDHRRAEERHQKVDELGRKWLASGFVGQSERDTLRTLLAELVEVYAAHIRLEDERVFEVAAKSLLPEDLRQVGAEMRRRRMEI